MVTTDPMPTSAAQAGTNEVRDVRLRLRLSQQRFATLLVAGGEVNQVCVP